MNGNPRCPDCNGRGGSFHHGRWFVCACTRPRREVTDLLRRSHEQPGQPFKTAADMIREHNEGR